MARRKRKKEKYIHRWLREHPQVRLYLSREEYEWLKELAEERGVSIKELVLEAIRDAKKFYEEGLFKGSDDIRDEFIDSPKYFYEEVLDRARERGIEGFEPCLFTVPCSICGKPIIFTHKLENWSRVREKLHKAFSGWYHVACKRKLLERPD